MTGPVFVDTNVLVYRHDSSDAVKQARAETWHTLLWRQRLGRLSFQVLQELYTTLIRGRRLSLDPARARDIVLDYIEWQPIQIDLAVLRRAWVIEERFRLSWWDALIVAAAQASESPVLLTEDLQHGQRFRRCAGGRSLRVPRAGPAGGSGEYVVVRPTEVTRSDHSHAMNHERRWR